MRTLVLLPSLLFLLLPPAGASGQAPNPGADVEPAYSEAIDVQVVNLEVFVTDKSGARVTGLTREDFQVREDGRPVEISNFFSVVPSPPAATAQAAQELAAAPEEQRLQLAIVIDDFSLVAQSRNRLLQSLREEVVPRLRAHDLALVATYAGSAVEVVQGLTADRALLLAALDRVANGAPRGAERAQDARRLLQEIDQSHVPDDGPRTSLAEITARATYEEIRQYAEQRYDESRGTLRALTSFVDTLAGLPGRKALLYVGGGLSLRPGEAFFQAWEKKVGVELHSKIGASSLNTFSTDLTSAFQAMVQHANGNRVTFYTLGATERLGGISAASGTSSWTPDLENVEQASLGDSLLRLADGTGGLASVNAGNPGLVLARMSDDFQSYYSLGFVPRKQGAPANADRKIEVVVPGRSDLVVRSRSGHRERPDRERMIDRTLAALLLDPGQNPLEVALEFTRETKKDAGQLAVEVLVKFPLAHLVLLPHGDFHEGKVSIWVSARDSDGKTSPVRDVSVPIRVPNDQVLTVLGQNAAYKMQLTLRDGEHRIAVAVRDELGNVDSAVVVPWKPGQ